MKAMFASAERAIDWPAGMVGLIEGLRCPVCAHRVREAETGSLGCDGCGRVFPVEDDIPRMLDEALLDIAKKRAEIAGWVEKARSERWYEPDDEVDAALPYLCRDLVWDVSDWRATEHSFQVLLDRYLQPGMRVLELGAAKCWGAQHLIPRGCEYVGTDILADANIGLGRGAFYERRVGPFPRIQADGEHLPFEDEAFDVTYCVATLHHALDLGRMVREMARVTRPGGLVAALNEGTRAPGRSALEPSQQAERELGINEHVHTVWAYFWSFTRAGLRIRRLENADGGFRSRIGRGLRHAPKVGWTLSVLLEQTFFGYSPALLLKKGAGTSFGVSIYARKP
jgi:SAM-dependent methyltransferase